MSKGGYEALSCLAGVVTQSIRNGKMKFSSLSNRRMRPKPSSALASCTRTERKKSSWRILVEVDLDGDTCANSEVDEVREEKYGGLFIVG